MTYQHQAVLCQEAVDGLAIHAEGIYIDATFGRGGHSKQILQQLGPRGRLLVIDKDEEAIKAAKVLETHDKRVEVIHDSFTKIKEIIETRGLQGQVAGVLFDLGVSSPQLDDGERGFSFMREGPLDMRMDTSKGLSARQWLTIVNEGSLVKVLKEYGEERFATRIARAIIAARQTSRIETTTQLALIISEAVPVRDKHKHPATRSFQAIRVFINEELTSISQALEQCINVLAVGGRLVVISFHSLEDRIVKRFMRDQARGKKLPRLIAVPESALERRLKCVGKAVKAGQVELAKNVRARSAVLRIAEKLQ